MGSLHTLFERSLMYSISYKELKIIGLYFLLYQDQKVAVPSTLYNSKTLQIRFPASYSYNVILTLYSLSTESHYSYISPIKSRKKYYWPFALDVFYWFDWWGSDPYHNKRWTDIFISLHIKNILQCSMKVK